MNPATSISPKLPATLVRMLDQIRRRHLAMSLAEFPIYLLPAIAIAWSLQAVADRVFDLSWGARCTLLILDFLGVLALVVWFVIRPLKKRLDRKAAALLAERGIPEFRSSLISAVELSSPGADLLPQSRPLVEHLLKETSALAKNSNVIPRVLPAHPLRKFALRMTLPVIAAIALLIACLPTSALLLKRILLSRQNFPARTSVISMTENLQVQEGTDATLTARAIGVIPTTGKLIITRSGSAPEIIPAPPANSGSDQFSQIVRNIREPFSYHFELNDGTGTTHEIAVHYPPAVKELRFTQIYPAYTGLPETEMSPTALKLLEGSTLRIQGTATTPLDGATLNIDGATARPFTFTNPGKTAFRTELNVPATGWKSLSIQLRDLEKITSRNDPEYPLQIERDKPPVVNLTAPKDDTISVLKNTNVPIAFSVSDDFGFSAITLIYQVFRPLADGTTEQAEPAKIPFDVAKGSRTLNRTFDWNLARILPNVPLGGSIIFWIEVTDNNPAPIGTTAIRSPEKTILIVSEEQKRIELLEKMGDKANQIEQLYQQQRAVSGKTESSVK